MTDPQPPTLTEAEVVSLAVCPNCNHPQYNHSNVGCTFGYDRSPDDPCPCEIQWSSVTHLAVERILAAHHAQATQQGRDEATAEVEGGEREARFVEELGAEARKYAVNRGSTYGGQVWTLTLAQLPEIALNAFRAALAADTTTPADEPERRGGGA